MDWIDWQPIYQDIVNRLSLDSIMDTRATHLLTELLKDINPDPLLQLLDRRIRNRKVVVCGAGPSLEQHIQTLKERSDYQDLVFVAADGAVSLLIEQNCACDIIVTDLDGDYNHISQATQDGALTIVHGHGDNMDKIREMVPSLGMILGSTQVEPTERTFLWGGFTDGDRACYVVADYSPREVILVGMDFGKVKLEIAHELITTLFERVNIPCTILQSSRK